MKYAPIASGAAHTTSALTTLTGMYTRARERLMPATQGGVSTIAAISLRLNSRSPWRTLCSRS